MDKESIDIKTAIQIAKIVVAVPEERMPIIWDIFKQAGLDIGGIDEMAEWKALTKQASGWCACRNCYRSLWEDQNHRRYTWDDLDGPRPTMEEYKEQEARKCGNTN